MGHDTKNDDVDESVSRSHEEIHRSAKHTIIRLASYIGSGVDILD